MFNFSATSLKDKECRFEKKCTERDADHRGAISECLPLTLNYVRVMMNAANSEGENDLHSNDEKAVGQASISLILPTCNLTLHRKLTFRAI